MDEPITCCTPLLEESLSRDDADTLAGSFKALADPARLRLVSLIAARGDVCACDLVGVIELSQPTISHHLKVLTEAGLLERERRGRWVHYRVDDAAIGRLAAVLVAPVTA